MNELVDLIVKKTGLPKETAQAVVNIVIQFLKDKLPDTFDALIDKVLVAGSDGKLDVSDAMNLLGGFMAAAQKKK
ncbi:MAG: hypothetical protein HXY42_16130 [Chloroflexi bacterium]|jgi:hypothetical protein|nr:hypothetical protein [Chloroflexota bacterium]